MSYSITARAASVKAAAALAMAQFHSATKDQRAHDCDRNVVSNLLGQLPLLVNAPADKDVEVTAYGHAGGAWVGSELAEVHEVNVHVSVKLLERPAPVPAAAV